MTEKQKRYHREYNRKHRNEHAAWCRKQDGFFEKAIKSIALCAERKEAMRRAYEEAELFELETAEEIARRYKELYDQ